MLLPEDVDDRKFLCGLFNTMYAEAGGATDKKEINQERSSVWLVAFCMEKFNYPRLQQRMYQMFGTNELEDLYFATSSKKLGDGFEEQTRGFLHQHPTTGLIIIDTLKRVRESGADYSYASDYDSVAKLKEITDNSNISMLIVHHTRKQPSKDRFDMISGTNGLLGAADGAFVLSKKNRTDNAATLDITG